MSGWWDCEVEIVCIHSDCPSIHGIERKFAHKRLRPTDIPIVRNVLFPGNYTTKDDVLLHLCLLQLEGVDEHSRRENVDNHRD